jgi:hypothetical protein
MSRHIPVPACSIVIIMILTAGCAFSGNTSGAPPLVTATATATAVPAVPATTGTTPPVAPGTQAPGTCTADTSSDAANCGQCGYACPANALCQSGQCYCRAGYTAENNRCVVAPAITNSGNVCPAGMNPCPDGYCYDLSSSASNCGICGNRCPSGMVCSVSTCSNVLTVTTTVLTTTATTTTPTFSLGNNGFNPGLAKSCFLTGGTICNNTCVNTSTSNGNCGSCGNTCTGLSKTCCGGTCTNLKTDHNNCGTCGHRCDFVQLCENGLCMLTEQSP